jgi:hypothetical protein
MMVREAHYVKRYSGSVPVKRGQVKRGMQSVVYGICPKRDTLHERRFTVFKIRFRRCASLEKDSRKLEGSL